MSLSGRWTLIDMLILDILDRGHLRRCRRWHFVISRIASGRWTHPEGLTASGLWTRQHRRMETSWARLAARGPLRSTRTFSCNAVQRGRDAPVDSTPAAVMRVLQRASRVLIRIAPTRTGRFPQ